MNDVLYYKACNTDAYNIYCKAGRTLSCNGVNLVFMEKCNPDRMAIALSDPFAVHNGPYSFRYFVEHENGKERNDDLVQSLEEIDCHDISYAIKMENKKVYKMMSKGNVYIGMHVNYDDYAKGFVAHGVITMKDVLTLYSDGNINYSEEEKFDTTEVMKSDLFIVEDNPSILNKWTSIVSIIKNNKI